MQLYNIDATYLQFCPLSTLIIPVHIASARGVTPEEVDLRAQLPRLIAVLRVAAIRIGGLQRSGRYSCGN